METILEAADEFLNAMVARGRYLPASARNSWPGFKILARVARDGRVDELDEADMEAFLAAQSRLARATVRTRFGFVAAFAQWCVKTGRAPADWTVGVERPKARRHEPRALEHAHAHRLLAAAPDARGRAIVALMLWCGLRCCEVAALDVDDWTGDGITVVGKLNKRRWIPVSDELVPYLVNWLTVRGREPGPLFVGRCWKRGERLSASYISKLVSQWCSDAGIKRAARDGVSAHACRHTAASDVLERCPRADGLRLVQQMLGHAHLATTEIYLRAARREDLRMAMSDRHYERVTA
jgi:integrase/recombinase XerC